MKKITEVALQEARPTYAVWLLGGMVLFYQSGSVTLLDPQVGKPVKHIGVPKGWWCIRMGEGQNGRFVAMAFNEDAAQPPSDFSWERTRLRVALYDVSGADLQWVGDIIVKNPPDGSTVISDIAVSEDGGYVAVAGWCNGVAVLDTRKNQVLWQGRPPDEIQSAAVGISAKRGLVYAGGSEGKVYGMGINNGTVVSGWWATDSGRQEPGQRVTSLCVSPDEEYVAAGTGPNGRTYVWSAKSGKRIKAFGRGSGGVLVAMFSPDSKHLAVFQPGRVEVIEVPGRAN